MRVAFRAHVQNLPPDFSPPAKDKAGTVWNQRAALADPRIAAHDQHPTLTRAHTLQRPIERLALAPPTAQSRPTMKLGPTHRQG
jgi:hypothetical protein